MTTMKVEINLNDFWKGYEGHEQSVQDVIIEQVALNIQKEMGKEIKEKVKTLFDKALEREVSDAVKGIVVDALNAGIQPTNTYGEPTGSRVPFKKFLVDRVDNILHSKVDSEGRPSSGYSSDYKSVVEWAANRVANKEINALVEAIKADAQKAINEQIKGKIVADVAAAIAKSLNK